MRVSIIIPVYNGASFIKESLAVLEKFLNEKFNRFEIIVVNDGSSDHTLDILNSINSPNIKITNFEKNQGKFAAIKAGMQVAKGDCRIFTDADLPYELEALCYIEELINRSNFHLVIGDRTLKGSEYLEFLPLIRRYTTGIFTHAVRLIVTGGLFDTQCGLKGFRADVAEALFPLILDKRFAADVELLYIALKYNLALRRIPVRLKRQAPSTVRSIGDGLQMLLRLTKLKLNWSFGKYSSNDLENIGKQFYWEESGKSN